MITNDSDGKTKMIKNKEDIPEGFRIGRNVSHLNLIDLHNTSRSIKIEGVPQVDIKHSYIIQ